jgi:UDP-glucuronate 4-epimerase
MKTQHILLTGGAGFIGSHIAGRLLAEGMQVSVLDNFDDYYDPAIKEANIAGLLKHPCFRLIRGDIADPGLAKTCTGDYDLIIHLAARVGVRPSLSQPQAYNETNAGGTLRMLEFARMKGIKRFILASSSSIYGLNPEVPWKEDCRPYRMQSPYAVSKRAAELYASAFHMNTGTEVTVMRLFTVYGQRQRPDLAIHRFARALRAGEPLQVFGNGGMARDYTCVDDVAEGFCRAVQYKHGGFEIFNIGNRNPVSLTELVSTLEKVFGRKARIERKEPPPGDVPLTCADINKASQILGFRPSVSLETGLERFRDWMEGEKG